MAFVSVTLCVERINFMAACWADAPGKSSQTIFSDSWFLPQHKLPVLREHLAQRPRQLILQNLQLAVNSDALRVRLRCLGAVQLNEFIRDIIDGDFFAPLQSPAPEGL